MADVTQATPTQFNLARVNEVVTGIVPEREYLVWGERRFTYARMAERANRLASLLHEHGIRLVFSEVSPGVYAQLENSGITDLVGRDAFYESAGAVVNTYRQKLGSAS